MSRVQVWPPRELPRPFAAFLAADDPVTEGWTDVDNFLPAELISEADYEFDNVAGILTFRRRLLVNFSFSLDFYIISGNQNTTCQVRLMLDNGSGFQPVSGSTKGVFIPRGEPADASAVHVNYVSQAAAGARVKIQTEQLTGNTTVSLGADGTSMQCIAWRY